MITEEGQSFLEDEAVAVIKCHPHNSNLFFFGKGAANYGYLMREGGSYRCHTHTPRARVEFEFMVDGKQVISSSMYHTTVVVKALSSSGCFTRGTTSNKGYIKVWMEKFYPLVPPMIKFIITALDRQNS